MTRVTIPPRRTKPAPPSTGGNGAPPRVSVPLSRPSRSRALPGAAAVLLALESLAAAAGFEVAALSAAALVLVPGLALAGLLPSPARRSWSATLAAAPVLGLALSSVALVTLASAGVTLDAVSVRLALAALVAVGLALVPAPSPTTPTRAEWLAGAGLLVVLALGFLLQQRVIGGFPLPGNDWAKYVLYADEIRAHGSLLIDNPFWMLGVPFREDPGVPAVYGAYLQLTGQPAPAVGHGIALFAALQALSVFALVRAVWDLRAGLAAAAIWVALPLSATILGWHGLANAAALALLLLLLFYASALMRERLDARAAAGAGITLVALAATHRLSLLVGVAALLLALAVALALGRRRELLRGVGLASAAAALAAPGVAYDLITRNRSFGGTLDHSAYLSSKLDLGLLVRDLTVPFVVLAVAAILFAILRLRRDRALLPLLCLLAITVLLAYSWLFDFPLHYTRMAYYLPLALVPLIALLLARLPGPRWRAGAACVALTAFLASISYAQGDDVDRFYSFANPASLKGLDAVAAELEPGDVVVTDRCWSFLATWLLHARTLPALNPADIQPKAELPRARQASAVLAGTPRGRAIARRLGVRFVLVDPGCTDTSGDPLEAPRLGRPAFVSRRLVVIRLSSRGL